MNDINNVTIVGRLTHDAEMKYTNTGTPVTIFSIAVNRSKKVSDRWEDCAHFFDVALWGKLGEVLGKYLTKGKQVALTGHLEQNRWQTDGQNRSKVVIIANEIQLLSGGGRGDQEGQKTASENHDNF